jgi:hypothetical protein
MDYKVNIQKIKVEKQTRNFMSDKEKNCTIVRFFLHTLDYIFGVFVFSLNSLKFHYEATEQRYTRKCCFFIPKSSAH